MSNDTQTIKIGMRKIKADGMLPIYQAYIDFDNDTRISIGDFSLIQESCILNMEENISRLRKLFKENIVIDYSDLYTL